MRASLAVAALLLCVPGRAVFAQSCGDAIRQGDEECDGADLSGVTCEVLGYDGGALACDACRFDVAACFRCGDGALDPGEACDGDALGPETCQDFGFPGGALTCTAACTYATRDCLTCGDGIVDEGEVCDGAPPEGETCGDYGYDGGALACGDDCSADLTGCLYDLCGDGVADDGEACDGDDLAGATCLSLGYDGGILGCTRACTFAVSACEGEVDRLCGNGRLEVGELCDGDALGDATCISLGYDGGELRCGATCVYDDALCGYASADVGRPDTGTADTGEPTAYEDIGGTSPPAVEVTPITIGCCGVEGGEPVEPDAASFGLALAVLGWLTRRRQG